MGKLDYLDGLGVTADLDDAAVHQQPRTGRRHASAVHRPPITATGKLDYTQIDPHFGTNAEMQDLIVDAPTHGASRSSSTSSSTTPATSSPTPKAASPIATRPISPTGMPAGVVFDDRDYAGHRHLPAAGRGHQLPLHAGLSTPARRDRQEPGLAQRPASTTTTAATPPSPAKAPSTATSSAWTTCSPSIPMWSTA